IRLPGVHQVPRLVGDRVGAGYARPDRAERFVRLESDLTGGQGSGFRRRRYVVAVLGLARGEGHPGALGGRLVDRPDAAGGGFEEPRSPAVAFGAPTAGRPADG